MIPRIPGGARGLFFVLVVAAAAGVLLWPWAPASRGANAGLEPATGSGLEPASTPSGTDLITVEGSEESPLSRSEVTGEWQPVDSFLLSGVVTTEDGTPVPEASVTVRERGGLLAGERVHATADANGAFEVKGALSGTELVARAFHDGFVTSVGYGVRRGARDVRLVLRSAGSLRARVVRDDASRHMPMRASLRSEGAVHRTRVWQDGEIHFETIRPGRYTFLLAAETGDELFEEDVDIVGGETTDLGDIAIEQHTWEFLLTVVDAAGEPIANATARSIGGRNAFKQSFAADPEDGVIRVLSTEESVDLEVEASGFLKREIRGLSGPRTVVLDPMHSVEIRFVPEPSTLADTEHLTVTLRTAEPTGPVELITGGGAVGRLRVAPPLLFTNPGTYRIELVLMEVIVDENGVPSLSRATLELNEVVQLYEGENTVEVPVSDADVEELRRRLSKIR